MILADLADKADMETLPAQRGGSRAVARAR